MAERMANMIVIAEYRLTERSRDKSVPRHTQLKNRAVFNTRYTGLMIPLKVYCTKYMQLQMPSSSTGQARIHESFDQQHIPTFESGKVTYLNPII